MGGGLLQIVAYGSQDIYLTGNPQITFFKAVYRRHTNFSMESIKQIFNGTPNFGEEVNITLQRNADLVHKMYLQVKLPEIDISAGNSTSTWSAFRWLNWVGHVLIKDIEISIGGQKIDKHYGEWLHIWNELSQSSSKAAGYAEMVGNVPKLTQIYSTSKSTTTNKSPEYMLYIPLQFWFCRNPGMAIPLIALQYSDIVVTINFRELNECIWANKQTSSSYNSSSGKDVFSTIPSISGTGTTNLYVDYIYLDTDERRRFSQVQHEYLIEQLQFNGNDTLTTTTNNIKLNFTHPVKEIIWVVQPTNFRKNGYSQARAGFQYFNYTDIWDYSGFTGTPEPASGPGMVGGKYNQNLWYGLPNVQLQNSLKYNINTLPTGTDLTPTYTNNNAGYNDISDYTSDGTIHNIENSTGLWTLNNDISLLDNGQNCTKTAKIVLNGNDRFSEREGKYFNLIQPYQHHTTCPAPGINVYSFALKPEEHQPSGTCNFSRIDNAHLNITLTDNTLKTTSPIYNSGSATIKIYAINYNILRIMSGMGGLAYSN